MIDQLLGKHDAKEVAVSCSFLFRLTVWYAAFSILKLQCFVGKTGESAVAVIVYSYRGFFVEKCGRGGNIPFLSAQQLASEAS